MNRNLRGATISDLIGKSLPPSRVSPQVAAQLEQKVLREVRNLKRQPASEINPGLYFIDLKVAA